MIGIIGAMDEEVKLIVRNMQNLKETKIGNLNFYSGLLYNKPVAVVKCGIGKVNAASCATVLIREFNVDKVINTGIAGALSEELRIFDFVVSTGAVYHDFDVQFFGYKAGQVPGTDFVTFPTDEKLVSVVQNAFYKTAELSDRKLVKGLVASGDQFISSAEKKSFIKETFEPVCTEMEGCAIVHTCYNFKVPVVIIRCISDMADDSATQTYTYNEVTAANECSTFVLSVVKEL